MYPCPMAEKPRIVHFLILVTTGVNFMLHFRLIMYVRACIVEQLVLTFIQLAGVHSYVSIPIFSDAATLVLASSQVLPSGLLVSELMRAQHLRALYIPPSMIEQWMAEPDAITQASTLKFVVFGGAPLSPATGDKLEKVTRLCQTYGSLETSGVQLLVPNSGEWSYLEFNPYEMCDMQEFEEGLYELVLHQCPEVSWMRALSYNFPDIQTWRTGDLFTRHPSIPTLWQFCSRVDDLIVMSNGLKIKPIPMELIIQDSPYVSSALIAGQGRVEPIVIIEPSSAGKAIPPQELYQHLIDMVGKANSIAPAYAQIDKSKIILGSSDKPFVRAPKGTVVRKVTIDLYASEVDKAYSEDFITCSASTRICVEDNRFSLGNIKRLAQEESTKLATTSGGKELDEHESFFMLGLDSLKMAQLAYNLRRELGPHSSDTGSEISLRFIYRYPTIQLLSDAIFNLRYQPETVNERPVHNFDAMKEMIQEYAQGIPSLVSTPCPLPVTGVEILILGPRGSLGPGIIRSILQDRRVAKIHCLNRSNDGRDQLRAIFKDRGFESDFDDTRLNFYSINLSADRLGLEENQWDYLRSRIHFAIHNAWKVDFSLPLESFENEYVRSVQSMLQICGSSPNRARLIFCSSISSVQDWATFYPTERVPEAPIGNEDFQVSSPLGYGQSKQVSERVLVKANRDYNIPVTVLRIGQVAGPTVEEGGAWSSTEWIPALAKISKSLKMMPVDLPDMDWIPSNTLSQIIRELILEPTQEQPSRNDSTLSIFNLVNPGKVPPTQLLDVLCARTGEDIKAVTLKAWVDEMLCTTVESSPLGSEKTDGSDASLIARMLPWFQLLRDTVLEGRVIQPDFETRKAAQASPTMATLKPITKDLLEFWCSQWGI